MKEIEELDNLIKTAIKNRLNKNRFMITIDSCPADYIQKELLKRAEDTGWCLEFKESDYGDNKCEIVVSQFLDTQP